MLAYSLSTIFYSYSLFPSNLSNTRHNVSCCRPTHQPSFKVPRAAIRPTEGLSPAIHHFFVVLPNLTTCRSPSRSHPAHLNHLSQSILCCSPTYHNFVTVQQIILPVNSFKNKTQYIIRNLNQLLSKVKPFTSFFTFSHI